MLQRYVERVPESIRDEVVGQLEACYQSSLTLSPPAVGETAPLFALSDPDETSFDLSAADHPVILSFYRGGWCRYCTLALRALQRRLPAIEALGGVVVAISPDSPRETRRTRAQNGLTFRMLSDTDNAVADQYGLRSSLAPVLAPVYARYELEWPEDSDRLDIPYPATFILTAENVVAARFITTDPAERLDPEDIAGELRAIIAS